MTKAQRAALEKLKAMPRPYVVNSHGVVETGVHTQTLHNLRQNGFISCSCLYLSGRVTPDLVIHGDKEQA